MWCSWTAALRSRFPLCPYPQVARYTGHGSIDDAASFACGAHLLSIGNHRGMGSFAEPLADRSPPRCGVRSAAAALHASVGTASVAFSTVNVALVNATSVIVSVQLGSGTRARRGSAIPARLS